MIGGEPRPYRSGAMTFVHIGEELGTIQNALGAIGAHAVVSDGSAIDRAIEAFHASKRLTKHLARLGELIEHEVIRTAHEEPRP